MVDPTIVALLQKIAQNTESTDSIWIAVIAGSSALAGAGISAWVSNQAAKRAEGAQLRTAQEQAATERQKLRASIVTAERLRWLQDLRTKVADFYSYIDMQVMHIERSLHPSKTKITEQEMDAISREAGLRGNQIMLLLNPSNTEQLALLTCVNESLAFMNDAFREATLRQQPPNRSLIAHIKSGSFDSMYKIGTKAWKKVQGLE